MATWGVDPANDRSAIRAMRSRPPGRAADDPARRRVFTAALGQFDELLDAANVAGAASRPLPLYYALNQAGRAIIAAHQSPGRPWQPSLHGLTAQMPDDGSLQSVEIRPQARAADTGILHLLAEAMNTPRLTHATTLAQVWAAIPNFPQPGLGAGCVRPVPLSITGWESQNGPKVIAQFDHRWGIPTLDKPPVARLIRDYFPRAAPGLKVDHVEWTPHHFQSARAEIQWRNKDGSTSHPKQRAHQYFEGWWLLPGLNRHKEVLSPFMLWWTLLLALSTIARYHPAEWAAGLDPDEAWTTVPIEEVLRSALEVMPRLVLHALRRQAV